jgi:chaperonin GroES
MKLKPVNDKVVVRQLKKKEDEITESGIILPDSTTQNKLLEGDVIAASKGMYSITGEYIPMVVEVGDRIIFNQGVGQEYNLDGEEVLILSQNEILSVVGDE